MMSLKNILSRIFIGITLVISGISQNTLCQFDVYTTGTSLGVIDVEDITMILQSFGVNANGDVNQDGVTDAEDLLSALSDWDFSWWTERWGDVCSCGKGSSVASGAGWGICFVSRTSDSSSSLL